MNVLIVDDEPLARDRLKRMVLAIPDHRVVGQAGSGQEAVDLARKYAPDIVFMDVRMPGMDGLAAAQHLAELEVPPAVIFCTAYDDYAVEAFFSASWALLTRRARSRALTRSSRFTGLSR